jgi:hypothetical protein
MQHRLYAQLPDWARPTHPILRYMLEHDLRRRTAVQRVLVRLLAIAVVGGLVLSSAVIVDQDNPIMMREPTKYPLFTLMYFPLVMLQFFCVLFGTLLTTQAISAEVQRETWESLKLTSHGAALVFRARWAAVFYQLRWLLLLIIALRVIFAGTMIIDTMDERGYLLDLFTDGITPGVSVDMAIILLAVQITFTLLAIPVLLGLYAAFGLLLAALVQNKLALNAIRVGLVIGPFTLFVLGMNNGSMVLEADPFSSGLRDMSMATRWWNLFTLGVIGDQGLYSMDLYTTLNTWTDVHYGVLLGVALFGVLIVEILLTDGMIRLAAWRAARPDRA